MLLRAFSRKEDDRSYVVIRRHTKSGTNYLFLPLKTTFHKGQHILLQTWKVECSHYKLYRITYCKKEKPPNNFIIYALTHEKRAICMLKYSANTSTLEIVDIVFNVTIPIANNTGYQTIIEMMMRQCVCSPDAVLVHNINPTYCDFSFVSWIGSL